MFENQELEYLKDFQLEEKDSKVRNEKQPNKCLVSKSNRIILTIYYILQITTSYILMLIVMTMNASLFISIIIGYGIGYWVFN